MFCQAVSHHINLERATKQLSAQLHIDYKKFKWHDVILYYNSLLYVSKWSSCLKVLKHCHDTYITGHFRIHKTLEFKVTRSFWWPRIRNFVEDYVRTIRD